jgi:hypothetical protein
MNTDTNKKELPRLKPGVYYGCINSDGKLLVVGAFINATVKTNVFSSTNYGPIAISKTDVTDEKYVPIYSLDAIKQNAI